MAGYARAMNRGMHARSSGPPRGSHLRLILACACTLAAFVAPTAEAASSTAAPIATATHVQAVAATPQTRPLEEQICTFATCAPRSANPLTSVASFGLAALAAGWFARRRTPSPD